MDRGEIIENPLIGQRARFVETPSEGHGKLVIEFTHDPGGGVGRHLHVRQSERFEIQAGEIELTVDGCAKRLRAGDSITVPPGVVHSFEVVSAEAAKIRGEFDPPGFAEDVFRGTFAIDARYAADGSRVRRFLDAARLARRTEPDFFWLPRVPWRIQAGVMSGIGRATDLLRLAQR